MQLHSHGGLIPSAHTLALTLALDSRARARACLGNFARSLDPQRPNHCNEAAIKLVAISIRDEMILFVTLG